MLIGEMQIATEKVHRVKFVVGFADCFGHLDSSYVSGKSHCIR